MTRDYGADSLRRAIVEFAAALPVYRTYVNVEGPGRTDHAVIAAAVEAVKAAREVEDDGAIDFVARLMRLDFPDPEEQAAALVFAARFQQTTGPVMAKAVEDTVFYRYNRLIALNEVGGDPDRFGAPVEEFHRAMQARARASSPTGSAPPRPTTPNAARTRARASTRSSEMPDGWARRCRAVERHARRGTARAGRRARARAGDRMAVLPGAGSAPGRPTSSSTTRTRSPRSPGAWKPTC